MRRIRRILCVIDPTGEEQPALQRAVMLARLFRAELELYTSCYYSTLTDIAADHSEAARSFGESTVREARQRLEQIVESYRTPGLEVNCRVEWHRSRHGSILAEADRFNADLIVKDTHYHTAISRALFTNTDWSLIRESRVPLWLVKPGDSLAEHPQIITAVDLCRGRKAGSTMDKELILASKELARALRGNLYVYHGFDPLPALGDGVIDAAAGHDVPAVGQLKEELRISRTEALDALAGRHGIAPEKRLLRGGPVSATLPETANEIGAALVVLGAIAKVDAGQTGIGSTAESVLDFVPCDLLVMRPPGDA